MVEGGGLWGSEGEVVGAWGEKWIVDFVFRSQFFANYEVAGFPFFQCKRCWDHISYEINEFFP